MSEVVGEGVIRIRTDESGVDVAGAGSTAGKGYTKGFTSSLKGIAVALGGVLAAKKVLDFTKEAIGEAREAQKVSAATEQIIKATGGAAQITAGQVGDLATKLSLATGVDDELIQSGQNLILTFKNVKNAGEGAEAIFDRTSKAALDLSAAGFGSVSSASLQLGKALNDPIKGMSALARSGVTFTQAQKDQVAAMVEQGDLLGAQKIILGEVEGQVGGVAEATATAGEKASVAWANVKETVGTALLPILDKLLLFFVDKIAPAITDLVGKVGQLGPVFDAIGSAISGVFSSGAADDATGFFQTIRDAVESALPQVREVLVDQVLPALVEFFGAVQDGAKVVLPLMRDVFVNQVLPALKSLGSYLIENVVPVFGAVARIVIDEVVPTLVSLATLIYGTVYPAIISIVTTVAEKLKPVFDQLIATFKADVLPTISQLVNMIRTQLIPALQPVIEKVIVVVSFLTKLAATILSVVLPPLIRLAGFIIRNVVPVIATLIVKAVQIVDKVLAFGAALGKTIGNIVGFGAKLVGLVAGGIQDVIDAVTGLPGKILDLGPLLLDAGRQLIGKLIEGLSNAGGIIGGIAGSVWDAVKGLLNGAIDKINAALEFEISIPGPNINVNLPNIPHLARGTRAFVGGVALVGEEGPELVALPRGSQVTPARQTAAALGGGGGLTIRIEKLMPHNYNEFQRQMLEQDRAAALGGRPVG